MYDLKIVGGTVVDGTGAAPYRADVGIKDGVIAMVRPGGCLDAGSRDAAEVIDRRSAGHSRVR
jgi:N-acyl-D-amino-acid deacylase